MDQKERTYREPVVAKRPARDFTEQLIEPFTQFRNEVDHLFQSFPFRLPTLNIGLMAGVPPLEMTETDTGYKITAELPGIDPENVDVTYEDGLLWIAGEKKDEREETERGYRLAERSYGAFERVVALPSAADPEKIDAKFKNGVLTITFAKNDSSRNVRRIKVTKGA